VAPNSGLGKVLLERSRSDGYEASVGESGDENSMLCQQPTKAWNNTRLHRSLVSPTEKGATWEDSPEDFMPRWSWGSRSLGSKGSRSSKAESLGGKRVYLLVFQFILSVYEAIFIRLQILKFYAHIFMMQGILQVDQEQKPTF
jgi:hypothetical protein